jgi:hypothetical protein
LFTDVWSWMSLKKISSNNAGVLHDENCYCCLVIGISQLYKYICETDNLHTCESVRRWFQGKAWAPCRGLDGRRGVRVPPAGQPVRNKNLQAILRRGASFFKRSKRNN